MTCEYLADSLEELSKGHYSSLHLPLFYAVQFFPPDAQGAHERIAEKFLAEVAPWHGLHGEQGDALLFVGVAQ